MARLAPRPWLMIHGERDTYISPEIARGLFDRGKDPKELWLVPDAKHNRCRETRPGRLRRASSSSFLERFAPRRPLARADAEVVSSARAGLPSDFAHPTRSPADARERSGVSHLRLTEAVGATGRP